MSEHSQNNPTNPNAPKAAAARATRKLSCEEWEAILVDFLDGTLPHGDAEMFHSHEKSCAACAEMLSQARQGREWLRFLRVEPPVPPVLVGRILAQTSGAEVRSALTQAAIGGELAPVSAVAIPVAPALPFWKRNLGARMMAQPRLMMTAAMAFFSITLTLNMAGVRISAVRLSDLRPASLSSNLDKQYHMASARVVRYYDNLRFVYEMEARVRELRRDADLNTAPVDKQEPAPSPAPDSNHKSGGKSEAPSAQQPKAMLWGEPVEAALRIPTTESRPVPAPDSETLRSASEGNIESGAGDTESCAGSSESYDYRNADQAERGIA
jgi:hypothetical protein